MLKEVIVSGKLTVKDLMSFLFYHNYSSLGGKLTGVLGIVGLVLAPVFFLQNDMVTGIVFALVALMYVIITPLDFYSKSLRQLRSNPVFKNKMTFVFSQNGLRTTMYTGATQISWDDVIRVASSREYFFIYIKEANALVVPKCHFACLDDIDIIEELIEDKRLDIHVKNRLKEEENHDSEDV